MAGELVGREKGSILFTKYGEKLKECRKLVHSWINKNTMAAFLPVQEAGSYKLLAALCDDPENFSKHIRMSAGSVILQLTYGITCLPKDDPKIAMAEELSRITAHATQPGRWLCDSFPCLAYVPAWFPGASFKRWASNARVVATDLVQVPFNDVITSFRNGHGVRCWALDSLTDHKGELKTGYAADNVMVAAGSMYAGGIDTAVSAVRTFFLIMARHPDVQRKAQSEIDSVVGFDRLPNFKDYDRLPYVTQVIAEILRFNPIVPLIPHSLDEDDIYQGYRIPKGSWVMVNNWSILHNPETYRNPEEFCPERFDPLGEAEPDPVKIAFGFGRRSCPGFHFALSSVFLNVAQVLACFDIKPTLDINGHSKLPPLDFVTGHLRSPAEFACIITPRNEDKIRLIQNAVSSG